jgi:hypothetical protein
MQLKWMARQLLPLHYRTLYGDEQGRTHYAVWQMWMGRCFNVDDVVLADIELCSGPTMREVEELLDLIRTAALPA